MSTKKSAAAEVSAAADTSALPAIGAVTYVDKLYISRSLILQSGRELKVVGRHVSVQADDTEALDYLASNDELQLLDE